MSDGVTLSATQLDQLARRVAEHQAVLSVPRLLDAAAMAPALGVPASWLLAEARANRVPFVKLGRYVRFDPEEVEAWWRGRAQGPRAKPRTGSRPVSNGREAA